MKRITFKYADALSNWQWREQTCTVESVEECIRIYNLGIDCDPTPYLTAGGSCNFGGSGDARFAMLIDRMRSAETEEALREAAYEFQAYFVESVPFVTLYFRLNSVIYSADIRGLDSAREPDLFAGIKDWYVVRG